MADWEDWLTGISGGLSGVVKGIDAGMAPLKTWEGIRTTDLANDRFETGNRDVDFLQAAREGEMVPDYYGQRIGAEVSGYGKTQAANRADIFGNEQKLALAEYLSDPEGAFQQGLKETGWTPGTPEYREWLAEAMSMYDPTGATTAYDKMGIPGIENRNLNEQAALNYIQNYARQKDPGATVQRMPDGTVVIMGADGEMTPVPGDLLVKTAAMINAKTPYDAISQGIKDEGGVQKLNIDLLSALQKYRGDITPASAVQIFREQGTRANQLLSDARQRLNTEMTAAAKDTMATDEDKAAREQRINAIRAEMDGYRAQMDKNQQLIGQIVNRTAAPRLGGAGGGMPNMPVPRTGGGGASVNAPRFGRPPLANVLNQAAGIDENQMNLSGPGGRPPYPRALPMRPQGPRNTGVQPITQGNQQLGGMDINQLMAFLQSMGAMNG